ncbi:hypothetical protein J5F27_11015 [Schleiferilactobacillus harbinensis]|jgi:hypothetical protein|uniref:Uncharacterized protein n=1 Tax=Schleiferilactobacillus harbinensis TaxID=304207 RepID=A0A510TYX1_9LACO|nr:hypothetical protein [Schleiferilactobacillus harbinensis]MBO3092444.1 hypothetical protein [Schleiferilactobacillus harbinensis]MCT2907917.1 hypothetical protein [Schleiferilactobacillus harbinensis]QFR24980.1 hypothetical protein D1010_17205 [Schleiferilactobacillus harbinensis]GEK07489.1 hypothetical protein LHA01_27280 [Schleiferilactobacillus harbinensis]
MLKTVELGFENGDTMRLPAKAIDLALDDIAQSFYYSNYTNPDDGAYESTVQEIGRGHLAIRKDWFEPLADRLMEAGRQQTDDPVVAQALPNYYQVDRNMVTEWLAQRMPANQIKQKVLEALTVHFVETMPADLTRIVLVRSDRPDEKLSVPWRNLTREDQLDYNELAINLESATRFIVMFDARDPHIQDPDHGRKEAELLGFLGEDEW